MSDLHNQSAPDRAELTRQVRSARIQSRDTVGEGGPYLELFRTAVVLRAGGANERAVLQAAVLSHCISLFQIRGQEPKVI